MTDRAAAKACGVHGVDRIVEAAPRAEGAVALAPVLFELQLRIEAGFEMRFADQRGFVAGLVL